LSQADLPEVQAAYPELKAAFAEQFGVELWAVSASATGSLRQLLISIAQRLPAREALPPTRGKLVRQARRARRPRRGRGACERRQGRLEGGYSP
jgi:hypothetical protein